MAKFGVLALVWCYISITIVQSYTGNYHEFVAICIVTSAQKWIKRIDVPAFTAFEHSSKVTMLEHYMYRQYGFTGYCAYAEDSGRRQHSGEAYTSTQEGGSTVERPTQALRKEVAQWRGLHKHSGRR